MTFEVDFERWVALLDSQSLLKLGGDRLLFVQWRAERSDFARFNQGRLRQAGTVIRSCADFRLIQGDRVALFQINLSGHPGEDATALAQALAVLSMQIDQAPSDPHLLINREPGRSRDTRDSGDLQCADEIDVADVVRVVQQEAQGHDLVGAYMAGPIACGLWSSAGAHHYFERASWSLDYSIYARGDGNDDRRDKAVKATVAGTQWDRDAIRASIQSSLLKLEVLYKPPMNLAPGSYRALLAPAALAELVGMMSWGGFSARAELTGQSPLSRLRAKAARFNPMIELVEDLQRTPAPRFQADGFVRPLSTVLIRDGLAGEMFCSPRTAREFAISANGADAGEGPLALALRGGQLAASDELAALGDGIAISNLWYLNFSDRSHAAVTGMTRFATLWVEGGKWVAPITPMRFDDSLFNLLGSQLQALGEQAVWLPELASYDWRCAGGVLAPSALISAMRFTL